MKKSIIALAVAGSIAAPIVAQADATLYGRVNERVVFQEDKDMNIENAGARIGVKGEELTDGGLTAFYEIEFEIASDSTTADPIVVEDGSRTDRKSNDSKDAGNINTRKLNAGLKGDFGKVTIGRFTNPFVSTYVGDVFEKESGPYQLVPYRVGNALSYATPAMGNFSGSLTVIGEGEGDSSTYEDVDGYIAAIDGSFGPVAVSLAYYDAEYTDTAATAEESEVVSLGVAYDANNWYVGLGYEEEGKGTESDVVDFAVKYSMGKTAVGAGYAVQDVEGSRAENERFMLGVYHDLGGMADTYVEYAKHDNKGATSADDADFNRVTLGYRVKF